MFGVELDDTPETIDRKVHSTLDPMNRAPPEAVGLCSIAMQRIIAAKSLDDRFGFTSQAIRQDIFDLMEPAFRKTCEAGPMVLIIDDLQWADPASAEMIVRLMGIIEQAPLLIVCAFRPERQSPAWQAKIKAETDYPHRYREIVLSPLGAEDTEALLSSLLRITDLPQDVHQLILRKADGNPYFVEEIVRSLTEQGVVTMVGDERHWRADATMTDLAIPDSLQALLMARIDRLGDEAKSTLKMASVIGRAFYYRILQQIRELNAAAHFPGNLKGVTVPTFREVVEWGVAKGMGLEVEMKEPWRPDAMAKRVVEVLTETNGFGNVIIISFDHVALRGIRELDARIRTEAITHARHADIVGVLKACGAESASIELEMFRPEDAVALHEAGPCHRVHMPRPADLAPYWAAGRDPRARVGEWLSKGLIDSISGDDVPFLLSLVNANPVKTLGGKPTQTVSA